jgi:CCR4-NOT transcription complex subunit 3
MERFKAYEREAKTKAYSKEGLQAQREKAKKDGKGELTNWLQKSIDELKVQIDTLEVQLEEESGGKKKKGNSGSLAIETSLERHNFHIDALEKILRLWQNDEITKDDVCIRQVLHPQLCQ